MNIFKKKINTIDGIYVDEFFDDTTKKVVDFYKKNPFPNYKNNDNKSTILSKGNNSYLKSLKELMGYKKMILEVGCGTGQFSNYFAIGTNNSIFALDPTFESLKIAKNFSDRNNIKNITYINGSIFEEIFENETFDFVFCSGVLHHTKDTYLGFKNCVKLLKKNGFILIGLYNSYAKFSLKKFIFKIFGYKFISKIDPILKNLKDSDEEIMAWVEDQYNHPVERSHSIDEVLQWFRDNRIEPIAGIPKINNLDFYEMNMNIIDNTPIASKNWFSRVVTQLNMNFNLLGSDGALFCILGRKK